MRETLALFNEHFKNLKKNECILKTNFDSDLRKPFFLPKHRKKIGFPLALKKFFLAEGIVVSERRLFALEKREGVQKRKPTLKRKFPKITNQLTLSLNRLFPPTKPHQLLPRLTLQPSSLNGC